MCANRDCESDPTRLPKERLRGRGTAFFALLGVTSIAGCDRLPSPRSNSLESIGIQAQSNAVDPSKARLDNSVCVGIAKARDYHMEEKIFDDKVHDIDAENKKITNEFYDQVEWSHRNKDVTSFDYTAIERSKYDSIWKSYYLNKFKLIYPLAKSGNSYAIRGLSDLYSWTETGFSDDRESQRLLKCAFDLGNPTAREQMVITYWHDRGNGTLEAIRENRDRSLNLAEELASTGDFSGIGVIGEFIQSGYHQYPKNRKLAIEVLKLCARGENVDCQELLARDSQFGGSYGEGQKNLIEAYVYWDHLAAYHGTDPFSYAKERDDVERELTDSEISEAQERSKAWKPSSWRTLKPEWSKLRVEISEGA